MVSGVLVILSVNIAIGLLFSVSYVIVAFANRGQKRALWFGVAYLIGTMSPIADLLAPFVPFPKPLMEWMAYSFLLAGLLSMSLSFTFFHGRKPMWKLAGTLLLIGLAVHSGIGRLSHGTLAYGFAYQTPLASAGLFSTLTVFRTPHRNLLYRVLGYVFLLTALHFLFKPLLLLRFGQEYAIHGYIRTAYALLSQASTGVLLLSCGVLLMVIVMNKALLDSEETAHTDALSRVRNRRGFDCCASEMVRRSRKKGTGMALAIFDIDQFKSINDTGGHNAGDSLIQEFAALLQEGMPAGALIGRLGGDEFAVLLPNATPEELRRYADDVRQKLAETRSKNDLPATVSGGITDAGYNEPLSHTIHRADHALYEAKAKGRNRIFIQFCGS